MILVPVKNLENAKERLSPVLGRAERRELAQAMLEDVLEALAGVNHRAHVGVVTSDSFAAALAERHGFEVLPDGANLGESHAIAQATEYCVARGEDSTMVIPGDIPLLQPEDIEQVLAAAPAQGSVLVPGWDGRGSNAVLRRPAGLFPLRFGNDSFQPHLRAAQATGLPCRVLQLPRVGLDVDNPADLARLLAAEGNTRAQRLLRGWKLQIGTLAAHD
ncbi:MAG TPA: 2-phospho-L-lactate guanylyltransferase [Terriglobales bacterium]|nr:2-phospho-L-lactate guanylyltransferase [Terriglobales bacterium]